MIDLFAREIGTQHLRVHDVVLRDLEDVPVDDDEVGEFARLERPEPLLLPRGVVQVLREHADRVIDAHLLLRLIAARGIVVKVLARNGGIDVDPRGERLHGAVRAAREHESRLLIRVPAVAVGRALLADALGHPVHVRLKEHRLQIEHHGELFHPLDHLVGRHLGVDDAERVAVGLLARGHAVLAALFERVLDRRQYAVKSLVADAVRRGLQPHLIRTQHLLVQLLLRLHEDAVRLRRVGIGREELRRARTERAVGEDLVAAVADLAVGVSHLAARQVGLLIERVEVDHHAQRQLALAVEPQVVLGILRVFPDLGGVGVDRREPLARGLGQRLLHNLLLHRGDFRGVGDQLVEDLRRLLAQDAVRLTVLVQLHEPAGAVVKAAADPGRRQRRIVRDRRVQAHALHHHRVLAAHEVEVRLRRQVLARVGPFRLVEVRAAHPLALRCLVRAGFK